MKLLQYLAEHGLKHAWFAQRAGIPPVRFSGIVNGKKKPTPDEILAIQELTKNHVTVEDFVEVPK